MTTLPTARAYCGVSTIVQSHIGIDIIIVGEDAPALAAFCQRYIPDLKLDVTKCRHSILISAGVLIPPAEIAADAIPVGETVK